MSTTTPIDAMVRAARAIDSAGTGYDQTQRWSFFDRKTLTIRPNGEADCATVCGAIARLGGFNVDLSDPFWTGNFRARLTAAGFTAARFQHLAQLRAGDFVLNSGHHVEFVVAPGRMFSANKDERGRYTGGTAGDQTRGEVYEKAAYVYGRGWDWVLRPPAVLPPGLPTAPAAATPTTSITATLRRGTAGAAVRLLQQRLAAHGQPVAVDGVFGPKTDSAVRAFQGRRGLAVDGVVGPQTWAALNSTPALASAPVLRRGDSGAPVAALQRALVAVGYSLAVDGDFGPATQLAVRSFQSSAGLSVDGIVGPQTYNALARRGAHL